MLELMGHCAGKGTEIRELTMRAMRGECDFTSNLASRLSILKGVDRETYERAYGLKHVVHGVAEVCSRLINQGIAIAIIGGLDIFAVPLAKELRANYCISNRLKICSDGSLAGTIEGEALDSERKQRELLRICRILSLSPTQCVAVGDGANDIGMIELAGLGVGFNAKEVLMPFVDINISENSMLPLLSAMDL